VRSLFSKTTEAEMAGWGPSFFSYNSGKGRCPECKGLGRLKLEMNFLPDAFIPCETCNGARFTEDALSVRYKGLNIRDVLDLTFEEAKTVFAHYRKIHHTLHQACELGLGYLTLGQSSSSLSGGESQRIKLVAELSGRAADRHTLYLLDEPTTGLHKSDVARLLRVLRELVNKGNSVLLIEHDSDIVAASDHIIEMGPGPGAGGGKVIFQGTPAALITKLTPWGKLLAKEVAPEKVSANADVSAFLENRI
jgi:excinuclease ABC subunit A